MNILYDLNQNKKASFYFFPFDKLLMPKVVRVYNLRIDIVTKREELCSLKMLFNKLTNTSSFR